MPIYIKSKGSVCLAIPGFSVVNATGMWPNLPLSMAAVYGPFSQERASNGKDNLKKKILLFLAKIR